MPTTIETYCPHCDTEVTATISKRSGTLPVRGEDTSYVEELAICPLCGKTIGDSRVENGNIERAFDVYRNAHNIVGPDAIKGLRNAYGLSAREFYRFLGIGEQTELRYEMGSIVEPAHNSAVLSAMAREGAKRLLEQNGERITKKSRDLARDYIEHFDSKKTTDGVFLPLHDQADLPPCPENGFRGWDFDRISELAIILSERCTQLSVTKSKRQCLSPTVSPTSTAADRLLAFSISTALMDL